MTVLTHDKSLRGGCWQSHLGPNIHHSYLIAVVSETSHSRFRRCSNCEWSHTGGLRRTSANRTHAIIFSLWTVRPSTQPIQSLHLQPNSIWKVRFIHKVPSKRLPIVTSMHRFCLFALQTEVRTHTINGMLSTSRTHFARLSCTLWEVNRRSLENEVKTIYPYFGIEMAFQLIGMYLFEAAKTSSSWLIFSCELRQLEHCQRQWMAHNSSTTNTLVQIE